MQSGTDFPAFTLEDSARTEYCVVPEIIRITQILAAVGLSMGAHQAFALAVLYPKFLDWAVSIVGSPQPTPYDLLSRQIAMMRSTQTLHGLGGKYTTEPPIKLANALGTMMVSAPSYRNGQTTRQKRPTWLTEV